jgi:VanZ family protein
MRLALAWAPAIVVAIVIYVLSDTRDLAVTTGTVELVLRKGAHLTIYGLLAIGCYRGLVAHRLWGLAPWIGAWLLAVAYAVSDELHQATVPTRHGAPLDVAIDAAGAAGGLLVLALALRHLGDRRWLRAMVAA